MKHASTWNQGEEDGRYEHYLVFLVKRKIRGFDVFFFFFLCLEERKNVQKTSRQRAKPKKKNHFFGLEVLGAFYSPSTNYKATALQVVSDRVDIDTPEKILTYYL